MTAPGGDDCAATEPIRTVSGHQTGKHSVERPGPERLRWRACLVRLFGYAPKGGGALAPPLSSVTAYSLDEISICQRLTHVMIQHGVHAVNEILCVLLDQLCGEVIP
jgi:hypothetical protein